MIDPVAASLADLSVLASTQRTIGMVIVALLAIAGVAAFWFNTRKARPELGAELELAPNRKPYYDDEELEGKVLDRVLGLALVLIAIIAVGLPLYWLAEPGRQTGAEIAYEGDPDDPDDMGIFAGRGEGLYLEQGCGDCHGGVQGGFRDHILLDSEGDFVAQVPWKAPALDTVTLRYSREEIEYVLNHGRPGTPMQAFGAPGGGPLTSQQIDNLIDYLYFVAIDEEEAKAAATEEIERSIDEGEFDSVGEAVFNLGLNSGFAGGAYSCGRCHTQGWAYGEPLEPGGGGTVGFSLRDGSTLSRFPSEENHYEFVFSGSEDGVGYGVGGQGSGRMPGFGQMLTEEQIQAVIEYERGL
ncbi:MAG: c-type cytochrome [Acidimicrobiales bacterium]